MEETTKRFLRNLLKDAEPIGQPGTEGYKKIADFNNIVLAAKESSMNSSGFEFVTWMKGKEGTVLQGNYYNEFENGKLNFLLRSELMNQDTYNELTNQHIYDKLIITYLKNLSGNGYFNEEQINMLFTHLQEINKGLIQKSLVSMDTELETLRHHLNSIFDEMLYRYPVKMEKPENNFKNNNEEFELEL